MYEYLCVYMYTHIDMCVYVYVYANMHLYKYYIEKNW